MPDLIERLKKITASMRGNESLVPSLPDDATQALLLWGETAAKFVVDGTADLDDAAAEEHMAPRLRALRVMMRSLGRWLGERQSLDRESQEALWNRARDQAPVIFGNETQLPAMDEFTAMLPEVFRHSEFIDLLNKFIPGTIGTGS